jgi:3-dehydroquinate synthase
MRPLRTGHDILPQLPRFLRELGLSGSAFVVSDFNVLPLYGERVRRPLEAAGWRVAMRAVPAGEGSKSLGCASELWDWLASERAERRDTVVALGGGVVGDLAGWVAATYLRGLNLIQAPTSLLAQVDSSIGGKTGIDHPRAKNLIGSFYPPSLTLIDTSLLSTLPPREFTSGWAEVVKTALIADAELFEYLLAHADALRRLESGPLARVVGHCAEIKLRIVAEDPKETTGRRVILNYGHTIGHAVEAAAGYGGLLHGEAVAVGLRGAARIAVEMGLLAPNTEARQAEALDRFGLPRTAPGLEPSRVLAAMKLDKKVVAGGQRWVLLRDVGVPELRSDVPEALVRRVVEGCVT